MNTVKDLFASMDSTEQIYWYIAIGASVIFVIQTILTFIGSDGDTTGIDADFDGNFDDVSSPFQLFSLRNLINFLLGLGWTGVAFYGTIENNIILGIIAIVVGIIFVAMFFFIMRTMMKLAEDNSFRIETAIGKTGDVYTTIPARKMGKGKILISIKGSTHELGAITSNKSDIKVGTRVEVIETNDDLLIVKPINSEEEPVID